MLAKQFPEARILAFGYDADVARLGESASLNTVSEHANNLLNCIHGKGQDTRCPIFFIGHSLGGLVIERVRKIGASADLHALTA
jgi:protein SERAC1